MWKTDTFGIRSIESGEKETIFPFSVYVCVSLKITLGKGIFCPNEDRVSL